MQPGAYDTNIGNSSVPLDNESRLSGYATVTPLLAKIYDSLGTQAQGRNSREVADAIFAIAGRPAGTRPLRTPVPAEPAITAINDAVAPIQRQIMLDLDLDELLPKVPVGV